MNVMFWLALAGLIAACFASIGARSLRRFSRSKLDELGRHDPTTPLYSQMTQLRERAIAGADSLQVLAAAVAVGAGIAGASAAAAGPTAPNRLALLGAAILGIGLLWLAVVWIPLAVARLWADGFVLRTWSLWRGMAIVLAPSLWAAFGISRLLQRLSGASRPMPPRNRSRRKSARSSAKGSAKGYWRKTPAK